MRRMAWLGTVAWLGLCACGGTSAEVERGQEPSDASEASGLGTKSAQLYDEDGVVEFHLSFSDAEWERFLALRAAGKKEYVHCSFSFADQTFPDAACRSKGSEEVWPEEPKPQFVITFDHWDKRRRFMGLRKLNLEANPYMAAPVRDRLGMWLMRESGLDAPRVNHARLFLNESYLGLYQNIEVIDEQFLKAHFTYPEGNLYEAGEELKTNKPDGDETRLWALQGLVCMEPLEAEDHGLFYSRLERLMDVHQVLRLMAAETVLATPDNFSNGSINFYYYDDPDRGFVVLPWDLDLIMTDDAPTDADVFEFWGGEAGSGKPNKLRQLMNQHPEWRQEFLDDLVEIRDGVQTRLAERADHYCEQIRESVAEDPNRLADLEAFDEDCADIQWRIQERINWLRDTLGR